MTETQIFNVEVSRLDAGDRTPFICITIGSKWINKSEPHGYMNVTPSEMSLGLVNLKPAQIDKLVSELQALKAITITNPV